MNLGCKTTGYNIIDIATFNYDFHLKFAILALDGKNSQLKLLSLIFKQYIYLVKKASCR